MKKENQIILRKCGNFYSAYNKDSYILYYLFNYKIVMGRVGFPINSINKVLNKLEEKCINYLVLPDNKESNFKTKNNYKKFIDMGIKKYEKYVKKSELLEKIDTLSEEKIDKIIKYVESVVYDK